MNAREAILGALRAGHSTAPPPLPPPWPLRDVPIVERIDRFTAALAAVGGVVERCADLPAALQRAGALCAAAGVRSVAASDAPELAPLHTTFGPAVRVLPPDAERSELLAADAGITTAQWGIAETGTLVLVSNQERHRLASLLPPLHVALLPASRLLGTLDAAFAALRQPDGRPAARTITFVTGPSRTADIELELVVGVHGPRALHVVLFEHKS